MSRLRDPNGDAQRCQVSAVITWAVCNPSSIMSNSRARVAFRRLEAVLYSLTAVTKELLALRQPALAQLQEAASWASSACSKVRPEDAEMRLLTTM